MAATIAVIVSCEQMHGGEIGFAQALADRRGILEGALVEIGEDGDRSALTAVLAVVQGVARMLEQFGRGAVRSGAAGDAAGSRDRDRSLVEMEFRFQRGEDVPAFLAQPFVVLCVGKDDAELVAVDTGDGDVVRRHGAQPRGRFGKHPVADMVAHQVVDRLEAVEIDDPDGEVAPGRLGVFQVLREFFQEMTAVGQAGQIILVGGAEDGLVEAFQLPPLAVELHLLLHPLPEILVRAEKDGQHGAGNDEHVDGDAVKSRLVLQEKITRCRNGHGDEEDRRRLPQGHQAGDRGQHCDADEGGDLALVEAHLSIIR